MRRAEMVERLGEVAAELLERTAAAKKTRDVRNLTAAMRDLVANAELLDGRATSRVEFGDAESRRKRVRELRDELEARRQAKRAPAQ
jgi:hypothetical protein